MRQTVDDEYPWCQLVNSKKEPDFSFKPSDCLQHNPTLVGEVAYQNESFSELKRELRIWTEREDLAKMCLGIHVNTRPRGSALDPYLTMLWKYHGSRHEQLAFGKGTACTSANLPQFMLRVPFNKLFARSQLVNLFGRRDHISIDLFKVRQQIQAVLLAMP